MEKFLDTIVGKSIGIDFTNPKDTAERYLRTAANLMPRHYWAHYWLGAALDTNNKPQEAELAYNTCVGRKRLTSRRLCCSRTVINILQHSRTNDEDIKQLLLDRGKERLSTGYRTHS